MAKKCAEAILRDERFESEEERKHRVTVESLYSIDVIKAILSDYCIVSREKAKKEYDDAKLFAGSLEKETFEYGYYLGGLTMLGKIFPDLTSAEPKH